MQVLAPGPEGQRESLLRLRHWCNCALDFDRQKLHILFTVTQAMCPPAAVIEAREISADAKPAVPPKTDVELNKEASRKSSAAAAKAEGAASSSSRPSAGRGGRGSTAAPRPRGRGRTAAPRPTATSSSSSSPTASSSSSSSSSSAGSCSVGSSGYMSV